MTLEQSIEQLYTIFSNIKKPNKIVKFDCITCLHKDIEHRILHSDMQNLDSHDFGGIMESCNVIEMGDTCYKYYIPRILELLTIWKFELNPIEELDFSFSFINHIYLDFGKFDYQNKFNKHEKDAVDNFFSLFLEKALKQGGDKKDSGIIMEVAKTGFDTNIYS